MDPLFETTWLPVAVKVEPAAVKVEDIKHEIEIKEEEPGECYNKQLVEEVDTEESTAPDRCRTPVDVNEDILTENEEGLTQNDGSDKHFTDEINRPLFRTVSTSKNGSLMCTSCISCFSTIREVTQHILHAHGRVYYKCRYCPEECSSDEEFRTHMKHHDEKGPKCPICGKLFASQSYLRIHLEYHKGVRHNCSRCDRSFRTERKLLIHLNSHEDNQYSCSVCRKSYETKDSLRRHIRIHECRKCSGCSRLYSSRLHLKSDLPVAADRLSKCPLCTEAGSGPHVGVYKGERCSECCKYFRSKAKLRKHLRVHCNIRYHCSHCGKYYSTKYNLQTHVLQRHIESHKDNKTCDQ